MNNELESANSIYFNKNYGSFDENFENIEKINASSQHENMFGENVENDSKRSPFKIYSAQKDSFNIRYNGGRVNDIDLTRNYPQFELFQENHKGPEKNFNDSLSGILDNSILSRVFFSQKNINNLQNKIISNIYNITDGKISIGRQSDSELKIIMRSIYLQNAKHVDCKITEQIKQLNKLVLEYCIENVGSNAVQYIKYIIEIKKPMGTFDNPSDENVSGTKVLKLNHFL